MSLNIQNIIIVSGVGADKVFLMTDLPEACFPYTGNATLMLDVAKNDGEKYCKTHFPGIPIEVVGR